MSEDLKGLIEKIQQEGIQAAESKARQIEEHAHSSARNIIEAATREAEKIRAGAQEQIKRADDSARASLQQAARNTLISLRQEITAVLDALITLDVRKSLAPQELAKIIAGFLAHHRGVDETSEIIISLNKEDLGHLEKSLFGELTGEIKSRLVLKASEDIKAGFSISYDAGKSHFDFTDQALAEYISAYLDPKLNQILKISAGDQKK